MSEFPTVRVEWVDSVTDGGWVNRGEAIRRAAESEVLSTTSVGYLLEKAKDYLLLATSYMRDGDLVQGTLQIPTRAVKRTDTLTSNPASKGTA